MEEVAVLLCTSSIFTRCGEGLSVSPVDAVPLQTAKRSLEQGPKQCVCGGGEGDADTNARVFLTFSLSISFFLGKVQQLRSERIKGPCTSGPVTCQVEGSPEKWRGLWPAGWCVHLRHARPGCKSQSGVSQVSQPPADRVRSPSIPPLGVPPLGIKLRKVDNTNRRNWKFPWHPIMPWFRQSVGKWETRTQLPYKKRRHLRRIPGEQPDSDVSG